MRALVPGYDKIIITRSKLVTIRLKVFSGSSRAVIALTLQQPGCGPRPSRRRCSSRAVVPQPLY